MDGVYDEIVSGIRPPPADDTSMFLTVTISPKLYQKPAVYQFLATINDVVHTLDRHCWDYCIVTELTDNANVHFHAWITLKNANNKYKLLNDFKTKRNLGFVKINNACIAKENIDRVYKYMLGEDKEGKNLAAAYDLIKRKEIVLNRCNLNILKYIN